MTRFLIEILYRLNDKIYVLDTQQALNKFQFPVYLFFSTCLHMVWGFPGGSVVKNLPANAGDVSLILGSGRSLGGGNGNPLQYSCLNKEQRSLEGYSPWGHKRVRHDLTTKQQQHPWFGYISTDTVQKFLLQTSSSQELRYNRIRL